MSAWDRREELGWDDPDDLARLIRDSIDEDTRGLVFPGAMAQRVIHGRGRHRRPWDRSQGMLLMGLALVSGAGVVGAAALVPAFFTRDGAPVTTSPSTGVVSAVPRAVSVAYVPRGWRRVHAAGTAGRAWTARYQPERGPRVLIIRVDPASDGLAGIRRVEGVRARPLRPYPVSTGAAVTVRTPRGRRVELRIYWEPRPGLLVSVRSVGLSSGELRKVVSGLRPAA